MKENPKSLAQTSMYDANETELPVHGLLVAGSISEGDWDIALKWAGDNNIKNNPSIDTFDKDAINWMSEPDYNTAAADYVAGKCEDRKEISNGKPTGNTVHVCLNGVVTWTPGDVTVATKRGGLVKVASSYEYRSMMPSVLVVDQKFLATNRDRFKLLMTGVFTGSNQIKAFPEAKKKASEISAKVYADEGADGYTNGAYWLKFFDRTEIKDKQHLAVSIFRAINLQQYPDRFKADGPTPLPEAKEIIDRSLISELADEASSGGQQTVQADVQTYSGGSGRTVSDRDYSINFATGSAQPLSDGEATLTQLKDSIAITGLKVKIDGYTDNTGSASINTQLSDDRAKEVKSWLQQHAKASFPDSRFVSVQGHGPDNPVGNNATADGRAANRRVKITLTE